MADQTLTIAFRAVNEGDFLRGVRNAETMARAYDRMRSIVQDMARVFAGGALGAGGLGLIARQVANVNSELQNATFAVAGLYNTLGKNTWAASMNAARQTVKELSKDAAEGVGELSDYLRTYQFVTANAGGHLGLDRSRKLTRLAIAAAAVENPETGVRTIGIDINQALNGGLNASETPLLNAILQKGGYSAKQFGALTKGQRADAIYESLQKYQEAADQIGKGWTAQVSTFTDRIKALTRAATGDLFGGWLNGLRSVNDYLATLIPRVERVAAAFSGRTGAIAGGLAVGGTSLLIGGGAARGVAYGSRILGGWAGSVLDARQKGEQQVLNDAAKAAQAQAAQDAKAAQAAARGETRAAKEAARAQAKAAAAQAGLNVAAQRAAAARVSGLDAAYDEGDSIKRSRYPLPRGLATGGGLAYNLLDMRFDENGRQVMAEGALANAAFYRRHRGARAFQGFGGPPGVSAVPGGLAYRGAAGLVQAGASGTAAALGGVGASALAGGGAATLAGGAAASGPAGWSALAISAGIFTAAMAALTVVMTAGATAAAAVATHLKVHPERWKEINKNLENVTAAFRTAWDDMSRAAGSAHRTMTPILDALGGGLMDGALKGLQAFAAMIAVVGKSSLFYASLGSLIGQGRLSEAAQLAMGIDTRGARTDYSKVANQNAPGALVSGNVTAWGLAAMQGMSGAHMKAIHDKVNDPAWIAGTIVSDYGGTPADMFKAYSVEFARMRALPDMADLTSPAEIDLNKPNTNVNMYGDINVVVKGEVNEDPRRIAVAIGQVADEASRHMRSARRAGTR